MTLQRYALPVLFFGVFALALWFRVWHLESVPGINGDEAWLGWKALHLVRGEDFEWKTHTGNWPNPFYFFPLAALHFFLEPSATLLRAVAVISGILALPVNYFFCRRVFNCEVAAISTLLLATLPVNIAYSRFGWEPSQMLLFSLPVLYSSLGVARRVFSTRWLLVAFLLMPVAFIVHPMNAFLMAFPLGSLCAVSKKGRWAAMVLLAVGVTGIGVWKWALLSARLEKINLAELGPFVINVTHLFSGASSYRYLAGSTLPSWCDILAGVLLALVFIACAVLSFTSSEEANEDNIRADRLLLFSTLVALSGFFIVLGAEGLAPANSRYGLWLIGPVVLMVALVVSHLSARMPRSCGSIRVAVGVLGVTMLAGFWTHYFAFIFRTGGQADPSFRAAARDPKFAAMDLILEKQSPNKPFVVASSDWWVFWPMRYRAVSNVHRDLVMLWGDQLNDPSHAVKLQAALQSGNLWFAEFSTFSNTANLRSGMQQGNVSFEEYSTRAYDGQPVISVFRLHQKKAPSGNRSSAQTPASKSP